MSNENKILNLIKLAPSLIIFITIITTYLIISITNKNFDRFIKEIEQELISEKKHLIKREVERAYNYIDLDNVQTRSKIKANLKQRVYEAYAIVQSIYENNLDKSKDEVKKLVSNALRKIRFNNERGYFFIYELNGTNIMHPVLPKLEGTSLWNIQDKKGTYIAQELRDIVVKNKEGFLTWWWTKPKNKKEEFEKIGFAKLFEPYNWYIGTGEYVADFEESLQKELLQKINKIKFGKNGYIFILDNKGTTLAHINRKYLGMSLKENDKDRINRIKKLIDLANKEASYTTYKNTNPSTNKITNKISYVKKYSPWGWTIGAGVYINDLEDEINKKRVTLIKNNNTQLMQIILFSLLLFSIFIIASIYFTNIIKKRFLGYKNTVKKQTAQLKTLNENLETKVLERTKELESINQKLQDTIKDLSKTKKDLILSQKMATLGELVSSITHEINTPLGISITSNSHIAEITKKTEKLYLANNMTEDDFKSCISDLKELSRIIEINLENCVKQVKNFKDIAVDQALEEKKKFKLNSYLNEILLALKSKTKKLDLEINIKIEKEIILNSYPNYIFQIFTNLINNSIMHGFEKDKKGIINISINEKDNFVKICYSDNGKGIPEDIQDEIFREYFTTKKGNGGTGLGLHIIKKIVTEKLNGKIKLSKDKKEGVTFLIEIPKNI